MSFEPIDVSRLHADPARLPAIEEEIQRRLEQLGTRYPQAASAARQRAAATELTAVLSHLSSAGAVSMHELVLGLRGLRIRGLGEINQLWPRLFVAETAEIAAPVTLGSGTEVNAARALRELFDGYLLGGEEVLNWAVASVLAERPASLSELHALLCRMDPTLPGLRSFTRAWGAYFQFPASDASKEPDWNDYWKHERQTAFGARYPGSIDGFLREFIGRLASGKPRARVLDIGTGNHAASLLARSIGPELDVYGVDLATPPPVPDSAIKVARMNAECLAFTSEAFDAAISVNGIEYARPELALPELRRLLAPGGQAALVLHRPDSIVTRRAREMNRFVRDTRLPEAVALAAMNLARPDSRLRAQLTAHLHRVRAAESPMSGEPFFLHLLTALQEAARAAASGATRDSLPETIRWCDGFLRWVLRKNEYVIGHAAQLGANPERLGAMLDGYGMHVVASVTLHSDLPGHPGVAAQGVIASR